LAKQICVDIKEELFIYLFFAFCLKPYVEFVLLIFLVSNIVQDDSTMFDLWNDKGTFYVYHSMFWLLFVIIMVVKHGFI